MYEQAIEKIRNKFVTDIETRLCLFDDLLAQVEDGEDQQMSLKRIGGESHKIVGVAKTLGFASLGEMAADVEHSVDRTLEMPGAPQDLAQLVGNIEKMLDHMDQIGQQATG